MVMVCYESEYGIPQSWWDHMGRLDHDAPLVEMEKPISVYFDPQKYFLIFE
jgi:hypothetical protein